MPLSGRAYCPAAEIERRCGAIVGFEREATQRGVRISKVMLHTSKGFQRRNLEERLVRPAKRWKHDPGAWRSSTCCSTPSVASGRRGRGLPSTWRRSSGG